MGSKSLFRGLRTINTRHNEKCSDILPLSLRINKSFPSLHFFAKLLTNPLLCDIIPLVDIIFADVAELADALDSGSSESNFIWVQVPSSAPVPRSAIALLGNFTLWGFLIFAIWEVRIWLIKTREER